jgi:hypothetical protein
MQTTPAWLTAVSILAPVIASFGVLWLSNRNQGRLIRAQHDLALEKDRIAATVSKAEQLYSDIQKWKRRLEKMSFDYMIHYRSSRSKSEFLDKITSESSGNDFDLVRLELNLRSYFSDLEPEFRKAHQLVYAVGAIQAQMSGSFEQDVEARKKMNGDLLAAQQKAVKALDNFSSKLAGRIAQLMRLKS